MQRLRSTLCVLALGIAGTASASVQVVFERSLTIDRSVNIFTTSKFDLDFIFADSFFKPTNPVSLFDGLVISPADVGRTFVADAKSDPGFADVVARLTDSQNQSVRVVLTEEASGRAEQRGFAERGFFLGKATPDVPDLAGLQIDAISLSIDSFILTPPTPPTSLGLNVAALTPGPPVQLQMTFSVLSAATPDVVPEPPALLVWAGLTTLALTICGVAGRFRA